MRPSLLAVLLLVSTQASAATDAFGVISVDTTWTAANGPYSLKGDVTVNAGVTLTLEPGVVVTAPGGDSMASGTDTGRAELIVSGTLAAQATVAQPITLTAATSSGWVGIRVNAGGTATLNNATVSNALTGLDASNNVAVGGSTFQGNQVGLRVSFGTVTLSATTFKNNSIGLRLVGGTVNGSSSVFTGHSNYAVYGNGGTATLNHCTIAENASYGVYQDAAAGGVSIANSVLARNGNSINWYRAAGTATSSYNLAWLVNGNSGLESVTPGTGTFSANPLYVGGGNFALTSNSPGRGAGSDMLDLGAVPYAGAQTSGLQGTLSVDTTLTGNNTLVGDLTVPVGKKLTLAAGATLKFAATDAMVAGEASARLELIVLGTLAVEGTAAQPVSLSEATTGSRWQGIRVLPGGVAVIAGLNLRGATNGISSAGGLTLTGSTLEGNTIGLQVTAGTSTVTNVTLKGGTSGLRVTGGTVNGSGTVITGHSSYAVHSSGGTTSLDHCTIAENTSYGVYQDGSASNLSITNSVLARNGNSINWYRPSGAATLTHSIAWLPDGNTGLESVSPGTGVLSANPLYVGGGNFALTVNSPGRGAGSDMLDLGAVPYTNAPTSGLHGTLWTDTTLTGTNTIVGDLTIPPGKKLTLAAGATLKFAATDAMAAGETPARVELIVSGTLVVEGTAAQPVALSEATTGSRYQGVRVLAGGTATLQSVAVRGATNGIASAGGLTLTSSTLEGNTVGLYIIGGMATVTNLTVKGGSNGLRVLGGTLNASAALFTGLSSHAIHSSGGTTSLNHCTVAENTSYGVYQDANASNVSITNSVLVRNGNSINWYRAAGTATLTYSIAWLPDGNTGLEGLSGGAGTLLANPLYVGGGNFALTINSPARGVGSDLLDLGAAPYAGAPTSGLLGTLWVDTIISGAAVVTGDLTVAPGVTLTLAPGATLTFDSTDDMAAGQSALKSELIVYGTLAAQGTESQPIKLTDATAGSGWYGVRIQPPGTLNANYVAISRAAYGITALGTATVTNSRLNNNTTAVFVSGGTATLAYLDFEANGIGLHSNGGTTNLSWSLLRGQTSYTLYLPGSGTVNADHNTLADNFAYGVYQTGSGSKLSLTNNIVVRNVTYNAYRSAGTVTATNNNFWLANGQAGIDGLTATNTQTTNPLFVSATDYHLTAPSPSRGAGTQGSDLGAYPFSVGALATIVLTPANPQVTVGSTFSFTAQGFDANANPIPGVAFSWTAAPAAGSINGSGALTAACAPSTGSIANAITVSAAGKSTSTSLTLVKGAISSVTLSPKTVNVPAGAKQAFSAVAKDNCQNPITTPFTWKTGLSSGAIDATGSYTAPCVLGTYIGAVQVSVGALTDTATVNVTSGALTQLVLSPQNPSLPTGGQQLFSVTGTDTCGNGVPSPAVVWMANGGGTISSAGLFTAGAVPGTYPNAVSATSGAATVATGVTVTGTQVATVTVSPSPVALDRGKTQVFTAVAKDAMGNVVSGAVTWTLTAPNAGTLDAATGTLTAGTKAGAYPDAIVATVGGIQGKATVTVLPGPVATVTVTPASATLAPNGTTTFSAQVQDSSGNVRTGDTVTWKVANAAAGSITQTGVFTASGAAGTYGNAIEASVGAVKGAASVTLNPTALAQVLITPTSTPLRANGTLQFQAQGKDVNGNLTPVAVTWSVLHGGGAISATGLFTAGTVPGTYVDTVQATAAGGLSATATVIVQPGPVVLVEVSPTHPELAPGATQTFAATAKDAFGNAVVGMDTTWVALAAAGKIDAAGLFTASTTPGDFQSAVTATIAGISGNAAVRVTGTVVTDGGTGTTDAGSGTTDGGNVVPGPTQGCGCNAAGFVPGAALLGVALLLLRRRRSGAR